MLLKNEARAESKAGVLRRLIAEKTVAMPGAFNAPVAMMAERTGFKAVYISGAGLVNGTAGYPDVGLLGMTRWPVRLVISPTPSKYRVFAMPIRALARPGK